MTYDDNDPRIPDFLPPEADSWRDLNSGAGAKQNDGSQPQNISGIQSTDDFNYEPPRSSSNTFSHAQFSPTPDSFTPGAGFRRNPERWFNQPTSHRVDLLGSSSVKPYVTYVLVALCVVVWLAQLSSIFSNNYLTDDLALRTDIAFAQPWRMITAGFVHYPYSLWHIGFNVFSILIIGRLLEPILGHLRFATAYLLSLIGGSTLFILLSSYGSSAIGASGAIFGMLGVLAVFYIASGQPLKPLITIFVINVIFTFLSQNTAWQSHLGGFLTGMAFAGAYLYASKRRHKDDSALSWLLYAAILVFLVLCVAVHYLTII